MTTHGRVRGRTIELDRDPGLADGQEVEVEVKALPLGAPWGDGLRRCAGALADEWSDQDDQILDQIRRERAQDTRSEAPE